MIYIAAAVTDSVIYETKAIFQDHSETTFLVGNIYSKILLDRAFCETLGIVQLKQL